MEISYKIPKGYIALILGIGIFIPLGAFGYIDDSFSQTTSAQWTSILMYLGAVLYFYITPRNKKIVASENDISVPKILFPPYTVKRCNWKDIVSYKVKYDENWNETLILKTKAGNIKIYSWLCFKDYELSFQSSSYEALYEYIEERLS